MNLEPRPLNLDYRVRTVSVVNSMSALSRGQIDARNAQYFQLENHENLRPRPITRERSSREPSLQLTVSFPDRIFRARPKVVWARDCFQTASSEVCEP